MVSIEKMALLSQTASPPRYGTRLSTLSLRSSEHLERLCHVLHDIDQMCNDLYPKQTSSISSFWLHSAVCFSYVLQFVIVDWSANPDGTFEYYTSNLWFTVAVIGLMGCLAFKVVEVDFFYSKRFQKHLQESLPMIVLTQGIFAVSMVLGFVATALVLPQIAAALWFGRLVTLQFFKSITSLRLPTFNQQSLLLSVCLLIILYCILALNNAVSQSLLGVLLFLGYVVLVGLGDLTSNILFGSTLDDLNNKEKFAFSFLVQIPLWIPLIVLEGCLLKREFDFLNLLPGYGFDYRALILCLFELAATIIVWQVQSNDILNFIVLAYTGNFMGTIFSYWYKGWNTFHLPTFILSFVIFLITLTYAYVQALHDRMETVDACLQLIREHRLPEHRAFRHLSRNGLLVLKEKLEEEERSVLALEKNIFEFSEFARSRKASRAESDVPDYYQYDGDEGAEETPFTLTREASYGAVGANMIEIQWDPSVTRRSMSQVSSPGYGDPFLP